MDELDRVKRFLADMTVPSERGCSATEIYQAFCQWHQAAGYGLRPMTQTAFGRYADEIGVQKARRSDGRCIDYRVNLRFGGDATAKPEAPAATPAALQVLEAEGCKVRVHVDDKGEPWFCANDVTDALGYSNGRDAVAKHVDADEKRSVAICYAPSGKNQDTPITRETTFISESGVYALVVRSNKPEAKRWWKRVRIEVLPAIRKTGTYISTEVAASGNLAVMPSPDAIAEAARRLSEISFEKGQAASAQLIKDLDERLQHQEREMLIERKVAYDELAKIFRAGLAVAGRIKDGDPESMNLPDDWWSTHKTANALDIHDVAMGLGFKTKRESMHFYENLGWLSRVRSFTGRDASYQAEMDFETRWDEALRSKGFVAATADTVCLVTGKGRAHLEGRLHFVRHIYDLRSPSECSLIRGMICGRAHAGELPELRAAYHENRAPNSTRFSHPTPKKLDKPDAAE